MPKTVHVDLGERGYDIRIGCLLADGLAVRWPRHTRLLLLSDANVDRLYGQTCEDALRGQGYEVTREVVPAGEQSKQLDTVRDLYSHALREGLDRSSVLVSLGGGVVGDLGGYVAATLLRGIGFVQIPTSLLAMVDSSVGGKTGVNLPEGKNLVGSFYQPREVLADLATLITLPEAEYRSGLAEVVKYGVIWDAVLFGLIEENTARLLDRDPTILEKIVARCCEIKAEVVALDERESGVRAILNFGHTFGHALEQVVGYGDWLHGEAVSVGMVYAAELSVACKGFAPADRDRVRALLNRLGLPVMTSTRNPGLRWDAVREAMRRDKKTVRARTRFVLAEQVGSVVFGCEVEEDALAGAAAAVMAER